MEKSRPILIITLIIVVIITALSFLSVKRAYRGFQETYHLDKAELIYEKAEEFLNNGETEKAISALAMCVNQYPTSRYAEESLKTLIAIYLEQGDQAQARYYYRSLTSSFPEIEDADKILADIEELNMKMMQSRAITEDSIQYKVQPGDTLYGIAKKFNTTVELIKKTNNLSSDIIRVGQNLKVNISTFSILVDKYRNILVLKKNGEVFKTYMVATGKNNSTPVGTFTIVDKVIKPPWTKPGVGIVMPDSEEYELGERWMAISIQGYGIHGTNDPSSIGRQLTAGCVRMHNEDVIELYDIVPNGTVVEIVDGKGSGENKGTIIGSR